MKRFPLFVDLSEKRILIVGAGQIATRRMQILTEFCNHITVVAPKASQSMVENAAAGSIQLLCRTYQDSDLEGMDLVLAATNDPELNRQIYEACRERSIPANSSSDQNLCDFQFPSIVTEDEIVVGINASGQNHRKVKETRRRIEQSLDIKETRYH